MAVKVFLPIINQELMLQPTTNINNALYAILNDHLDSYIAEATMKSEGANWISDDMLLVDPENLTLTGKTITLKDPSALLNEMNQNGLMKEFEAEQQLFDPALYFDPYGVHGLKHVWRVLFLVYGLSHMLKVDKRDRKLLSLAVQIHDIGRTSDGEDPGHGVEGYKKAVNLSLLPILEDEEIETLRFIVENHCINDGLAAKQLSLYNINDPNRALRLLSIFKDADGLDRVRISDLDARYLRNTAALELFKVSHDLLKYN